PLYCLPAHRIPCLPFPQSGCFARRQAFASGYLFLQKCLRSGYAPVCWPLIYLLWVFSPRFVWARYLPTNLLPPFLSWPVPRLAWAYTRAGRYCVFCFLSNR